MSTELQDFLRLSYVELEEKNLRAKEQRMKRVPNEQVREERLKYLTDETRIKAHRLIQRSRRPLAHARLRQEVPGQELGQFDV